MAVTRWTISKVNFCTITRRLSTKSTSVPIIALNDATFLPYNSASGARRVTPIFEHVTFALGSNASQKTQWAIISPSSAARTSFLQVLTGQYVVQPPSARTYPALSEAGISPLRAIKYVGFDADRGSKIGGNSLRGAYLSARYESRREDTDFSVRDYLSGNTELNAAERTTDDHALEAVIQALNLTALADMPVSNLSNGQTRRARIAKALMDRPQVLLLDGPFMGLDPKAVESVSDFLRSLVEKGEPQLVISLRPQDVVPEWIDSLVVIAHGNKIIAQGPKHEVQSQDSVRTLTAPMTSKKSTQEGRTNPELGEAVIEMEGVQVSYGSRTVLGGWTEETNSEHRPGLWWSLHRGQRCGIFGSNGSGKTTMLSLITSDHPQTYGLPIKIFGRSRLPQPGVPGISVFDLQKRMGHSSPEVHAFFPKQLTVRRALESAWADAPLAKPTMDQEKRSRVDDFLNIFAADLYKESEVRAGWATQVRFSELSFGSQRLLLFLRAIVSQPDLIILDEAFSGIDETIRDKAFAFLADGHTGLGTAGGTSDSFSGLTDDQALLVVSHAKDDVPECVREWICLPEPGTDQAPRSGTLKGSLKADPGGWDQIWDTNTV